MRDHHGRMNFRITCVVCGRVFWGRQFDPRPDAVRSGIGPGANSSDRGTCRNKEKCRQRVAQKRNASV